MTSTQPRRGRPEAIPVEELAEIRNWFPEVKTKRGLQNRCYEVRALGTFYHSVDDQERFRHMLPPQAELEAGTAGYSSSTLSQLGRMDEGDAIAAADHICREKMTPAESVRFLKSLRCGGRNRKPSRLSLLKKLANVLDAYTAAHDCDADFVLSVVEDFSEIVSETREANE
ncbi:hypothetical protein [Rosistilla oblonga]|uniref:hypothetical protein n=1 Tax=Rosistilla oblonga TaxID=2527990 RepID=UPI003A988480